MAYQKLPIGVDLFENIMENKYYYVDKTGLIKDLLGNLSEVNLFVRPRRFGKTLAMSMLKCFFELGTDKTLFAGLEIMQETELCEQHMGKYPVIFLSLKQAWGADYESAQFQLAAAIQDVARKFDHLPEGMVIPEADRKELTALRNGIGNLEKSLLNISQTLYQIYGKKVVILIDEYDVPLQKAVQEGYYKEMARFISQWFSYGMKTNPYVAFSVVTGCLRVSKESIFTGFNNPKMHTIIDRRFDEWFGFTDKEVREMLAFYGQEVHYETTKAWYDGYLFGDKNIYCPWDVINWVDQILYEDDKLPRNYWANSSGNAIIREFAELADRTTKEELEQLIEGKSITKPISFELTYDNLYASVENIWSVLFMTGYLTFSGRTEIGEFVLRIPNKEIQILFRQLVKEWFRDKVLTNKKGLDRMYTAIDTGDANMMETFLNRMLGTSISYMDGGKRADKETFYHGLMLGMMNARSEWEAYSNRESGDGRSDLIAYAEDGEMSIIFEFKYVNSPEELEDAAGRALEQIVNKHYDRALDLIRPDVIRHCGIAFYKKQCKVVME